MGALEDVLGKREDYDNEYKDALTLGQVIDILKKAPQDKEVRHGFGGPHSYRGYYDCLGFIPIGHVQVKEMLYIAKRVVGRTFTGWKGGDFTMTKDTKVYLANVGSTGEPLTEKRLMKMLGLKPKKEKVELLPRTGKKRSVKAIVQDIRQRFYWVVQFVLLDASGGVRMGFTSPSLFRTEEEARHLAESGQGDNSWYTVTRVEMGSFTKSQLRRLKKERG